MSRVSGRAYDWICERNYRAHGLAAITGGLMWAGIIEGYRIGHRIGHRYASGISNTLQVTVSAVWGNLREVWQIGGGSWAGPLRWGLAASIAGMVWFIGVGIVEAIRRRSNGES